VLTSGYMIRKYNVPDLVSQYEMNRMSRDSDNVTP